MGWGRSRCPACGTTLRPRDLVPLWSWLALRGRCRYCGSRLGAWYPLVELAAAAIGTVPFLLLPGLEAWVAAVLGWWLLALALIDLVAWTLPDALTLPLILAGLLLAALGAREPGLPLPTPPLWDAAAGAALGYLGLAAIRWTYQRLRGREGLGLGDAKLFAAAGAWLGVGQLPLFLLTASVLGLVMALVRRQKLRAETEVPFGAALALAFWALFLLGPRA
jgi:leader peptidase (prepilin peptidase)/N-methyltransferase